MKRAPRTKPEPDRPPVAKEEPVPLKPRGRADLPAMQERPAVARRERFRRGGDLTGEALARVLFSYRLGGADPAKPSVVLEAEKPRRQPVANL